MPQGSRRNDSIKVYATNEWVNGLVADNGRIALVDNGVEVVASLEDLFAQFGDGSRDGDRLQASPREGTIADAGDTAWDVNMSEVGTVCKSHITDMGKGIR